MDRAGRPAHRRPEDLREFGNAGMAVTGGASLVALLSALVLTFDPAQILNPQGREEASAGIRLSPAVSDAADFLADSRTVWEEQLRGLGREYRPPRAVLFRGPVESGCGLSGPAAGPFYCPEDETLYLDLDFHDELRAPAWAFVIAHEVGHHVQHLLGLVAGDRSTIRLELQADFLAGLLVHHAGRRWMGPDPESAVREACAVRTDSATHGTTEQRLRWFRVGLETGDFRRGEALFTLPDGDF